LNQIFRKNKGRLTPLEAMRATHLRMPSPFLHPKIEEIHLLHYPIQAFNLLVDGEGVGKTERGAKRGSIGPYASPPLLIAPFY
jgi:hypothetical protein